MSKTQEESPDLDQRAAQLANLQPQQLLGYIAALLESQIAQSKATLWLLKHELLTVKVENDILALKVEVENDDPIPVKVENRVEVESPEFATLEVMIKNDSSDPVPVEVTNYSLNVEVTNTPLN